MRKTSRPKTKPSAIEIQSHFDLFKLGDVRGLDFFRENFGYKVKYLVKSKLPYYPDYDIIISKSFEKTLANHIKIESPADLINYTKRIAFIECLKLIESRQKERKNLRDYQHISYHDDPDRDLDLHLIHAIVSEGLNNMDEGIERDIIDDIYNENMDNQQLSQKYGLPDNKLRSYKSRAIKRFKAICQLLQKKYGI